MIVQKQKLLYCEQIAEFEELNGQCQYESDGSYPTTIQNNSTPLNPPTVPDTNFIIWTITNYLNDTIYIEYQDGYGNTDLIYNFDQAGTYIVHLEINGTNCSGTTQDTIEIWPNPTAIESINIVDCFNDNTGSIDLSITGGTTINNINPYNIS